MYAFIQIVQTNPKPQTMNNLLSNKTPQANRSGDAMSGSVVLVMLGAFLFCERSIDGGKNPDDGPFAP